MSFLNYSDRRFVGEVDVTGGYDFHARRETIGDGVFAEILKAGGDIVPHCFIAIKGKHDLTA